MSGSKIVNCTCKNSFQDKLYGIGRRLANYARKSKAWRCTVCLKEHPE